MRATFPVTVHLLFFRQGKVLLSRRHATGYMDGCYSVPAGHLEGDETVTQAAIREAREETGIELSPQSIIFSGVLHRREEEERVDFFVRVQDWSTEPVNAEPHKCDDLRWVMVDDLPENTVPYVRQGIQNALAGIPFAEFGWGKTSPLIPSE